jgi:hypothetical protein
VKKIGFLSFGHWNPGPHSLTRSGSDALQRSIELAVAAEQLGADGGRKLVAYLGLDPHGPPVRRGAGPHRPDLQRGNAQARWCSWKPPGPRCDSPGPLRAFYQHTQTRRGHGKAIVATARKLAVLFWCMLTRDQDYAHQQPSLTRKKGVL